MTDLKENLKSWISLPGLSGYEKPVRESIAEVWQPLVNELHNSQVGSLHGLRRGNGPEPRPGILLAAHMDAIGMIVTGINGGLLRFTDIGGIDNRILPGTIVNIHAKKLLTGIVIQPPDYLLPSSQQGKAVGKEYLYIDTGLREQEVTELVGTGDVISFAQLPIELSGDALAGHSLDNRASVAALTSCLQELNNMQHAWDVIAVATVQEEVGLVGGYTSPFEIRPQIAVAIDVGFAKGPGANDWRTIELSKGPSLGWGPNIHPYIFKRFEEIAKQYDIPHQKDYMPRHSGTDAYAMQVVAEGIPTMLLSVPLRYMHTPVELVSMKDIERTGRLLAQTIVSLEMDFLEKISWDEAKDD